jgi:hypothetical protein
MHYSYKYNKTKNNTYNFDKLYSDILGHIYFTTIRLFFTNTFKISKFIRGYREQKLNELFLFYGYFQ